MNVLALFISMLAGTSARKILVADRGINKVYLTEDTDGDGVSDVSTLYVDDLDNVFAMRSSPNSPGVVWMSSGTLDAVLRVEDLNSDGDALDEGEVATWFSSDANGLSLAMPTPQDVFEDENGAVYILNAGTGSEPADYVVKTEDKNNDGDANDAGEATIWLDLGATVGFSSSAFTIDFVDGVAYLYDTFAGSPRVWKAVDANSNGVIDSGEITQYADFSGAPGFFFPFAVAMVEGTTDLIAYDSTGLFLFSDKDNSGDISTGEADRLWDPVTAPSIDVGVAFDVKRTSSGDVYVTSSNSGIVQFIDKDNDGLYNSAGEVNVWVPAGANSGEFVDSPRSVEVLKDPTLSPTLSPSEAPSPAPTQAPPTHGCRRLFQRSLDCK